MQLELFKALQSISVDDERATAVVASLEDFQAMKMKEATAGLETAIGGLKAELTSATARLDAKIDALTTITENMRWLIGAVGVMLAVIALASPFARLFH
jgi:hypothetical protein